MILENLAKAADPKACEERAELTNAELAEAVQHEFQALQKSVSNLRLLFLVQGLKASDPYVAMVKDNLYGQEAAHIAPRVRMDKRYNTPSFYWERTIRRIHDASTGKQEKNKNESPSDNKTKRKQIRQYNAYYAKKGETGKREVTVTLISAHIPVNKKTLATSDSHFDTEPEWAKAAFSVVEPELVALRRKSKLLSSIHRFYVQLTKV